MNIQEKFNKAFNRYLREDLVKKYDNKYNRQAIDFLIKSETTINITKIGQSIPSWGKQAVNTYSITLKNKKGEYTFTFYDSINNTEKNKPMTYDAYSPLACLYLNYSSNFDDFCQDLGYTYETEREYINVKKIYLDCIDQDNALRKMFTNEELEMLSEIN